MRSLVVACDAGGAEVLSSWVNSQAGVDWHFWLKGPALPIFQRKSCQGTYLEETPPELRSYGRVITGSGIGDFEKSYIYRAKREGVRVVTYLDHWMNYGQRFMYQGKRCYPNEIWVCDEEALALARQLEHHPDIVVVGNPYLEQVVGEINALGKKIKATSGLKILFACEPRTCEQYSEYDALQGFLEFLISNFREQSPSVRVRPHPSDHPEKYDSLLAAYSRMIKISVSSESTLQTDCAWCDWVVGCQTMALVVGLKAGRRAISCIPPGGPDLVLPHRDIVKLFSIGR